MLSVTSVFEFEGANVVVLLAEIIKAHSKEITNYVEAGGVKNWSKLLTDSSEKVPTWRKGVSKIQKKCLLLLWTFLNTFFQRGKLSQPHYY